MDDFEVTLTHATGVVFRADVQADSMLLAIKLAMRAMGTNAITEVNAKRVLF